MKISKSFIIAAILLLATTITSAQTKENTTTTLKTISTKVKGITCSSDLKTIATNVTKLEGVNTCTTDKAGATTTFNIAYNPALISEKEINAAIQNTGGCKNPNDRPYKVKE